MSTPDYRRSTGMRYKFCNHQTHGVIKIYANPFLIDTCDSYQAFCIFKGILPSEDYHDILTHRMTIKQAILLNAWDQQANLNLKKILLQIR